MLPNEIIKQPTEEVATPQGLQPQHFSLATPDPPPSAGEGSELGDEAGMEGGVDGMGESGVRAADLSPRNP